MALTKHRQRCAPFSCVVVLGLATIMASASPLGDYGYSQPQYYSPPAPAPEYYAPAPEPQYYTPPPAYSPPPVYYSSPSPPAYSPPPPTYYSSPPPPAYSPPPYYAPPAVSYKKDYYVKPEYYKKEYYPEYVNWEAVNYQELNVSLKCGVAPAVNEPLYKFQYDDQDYQSKYGPYGQSIIVRDDTAPFGKYPWDVRITDEYENYLCAGVIVHNRQILTLASCVYDKEIQLLRVRYGDWDVLNDQNEYEAYKNYETRICRILPVTCPSSYGGYGYNSYQEQYSELVLLQVDCKEDYDKYPQIKPACLPEWPSYTPPPTYAPSYTPAPSYSPSYTPAPSYSPSYNPTPSYAPAYAPAPSYPPAYAPAPTYAPAYPPPPSYTPSYSPPPYSAPSYAAAPYAAPPAYAPSYAPEYYSDCWVEGYYASPQVELKNHKLPYGYSAAPKDYNPYSYEYKEVYSKVPRQAQVKQVKPYGYQKNSYSQQCDEEQEWVGVYGYDACVADKGSAIVCYVPEPEVYSSPSYESSYGSDQASYQQAPTYEQYQNYKEIKVAPAQTKEKRKRAVVVAIVKEITQCTDYEPQTSYGYGESSYSKQQSKTIKAVKVNYNSVDFIINKFFEGALDYSCPSPKAYYPEPNYYPEEKQAYTPSYSVQSYSPPSEYYQPPSYPAPSYSPPEYYAPPTYSAPSYSPPEYYAPPTYPAPSYAPTEYYTPPTYPAPSYSPPEYYAPPTYPAPSYPPPEYYTPPTYPAPSYAPTEYYTPPTYPAPSYSTPSYTPPPYSPPTYTQPEYYPSAPAYQPPSYPQPSYSTPDYYSPPEKPAYKPPSYSQPTYATPEYYAPAPAPAYPPPSYPAPQPTYYEAPSYPAPAPPAYEAPSYQPEYYVAPPPYYEPPSYPEPAYKPSYQSYPSAY